jgi:hypothetical protein
MKINVGSLDSAIRAMIALALLLGAGALIDSLVVSFACVLVALLLAWTALSEWCPLYALLGIDTRGGDAGGHAAAPPKA